MLLSNTDNTMNSMTLAYSDMSVRASSGPINRKESSELKILFIGIHFLSCQHKGIKKQCNYLMQSQLTH